MNLLSSRVCWFQRQGNTICLDFRSRLAKPQETVQPSLVTLQSAAIERTPYLSTVSLCLYYSSTPQHSQMPRDQRLTESQLRPQLSDCNPLVLRKILHYLQALSIRKSAEVNRKFLHGLSLLPTNRECRSPAADEHWHRKVPFHKPNLNKASLICY